MLSIFFSAFGLSAVVSLGDILHHSQLSAKKPALVNDILSIPRDMIGKKPGF
jgi:hypothetical protein